ncbi:uncharacterized protein GBIM_07731 [Gryllus bimaculatus]|nr:uncharacterized protein GBIM_07731 [Gryllus bimaculatus]
MSWLFSRRFTATAPPSEEASDEADSSAEADAEADDDGRVYKNPRNSPSALCPRDEEQATLLGQKCLRKCSSDEDCKSKKKKCLCDGACGMSCIKPEKEEENEEKEKEEENEKEEEEEWRYYLDTNATIKTAAATIATSAPTATTLRLQQQQPSTQQGQPLIHQQPQQTTQPQVHPNEEMQIDRGRVIKRYLQ